MSFNGSGLFSLSDTIDNNTTGDAVEVNNILQNIAVGLSNTVCKDGQTTITANLPMNGFKFTGLGAGSARTDSATLANLQDGTGIYVTSVSGTANALTLLPSPAIAAYATGQNFRFMPIVSNTAATTVAISGLAAKPLYSRNGTELVAGDLRGGDIVEIYYDASAGSAGAFILGGGGFQSQLTGQTIISCTLSGCITNGDPTTDLGLATKQYVDAVWTTGDVKVTLRPTADTGWVVFDDGTIGSASSGATTRANADTEDLFTLLWNNTTNANCAVSSGRGTSAAADFAANKTIALPKFLGRMLAVAGAGSGLTSRALAVALGSEDATTVSHTHTLTDPGHTHTMSYDTQANTGVGGSNLGGFATSGPVQGVASYLTGAGSTNLTVNSSGSSGTGANMPPSIFLHVHVKL